MKQLKFRAWDTERKIFIPQGEIIFRDYGETEIEVYPNDQSYIGDSCHNGEPQRGRFVVSQFTGLSDKNGKEIYEGDICRWPSGHLSLIDWNNDRACFTAKAITQAKGISRSGIVAKYIEIVGNQFENPELLKEVEKGMKENKSS